MALQKYHSVFITFFLGLSVFCAPVGAVAAPDLDPALLTPIQNDPFRERLRSGYLELAESSRKQGNREQEQVYIRKAISTVHGLTPSTESLYSKDIALNRLNALLGSKYFLESALVNGVRDVDPLAAAEAQLMYDCWIEQEETFAKKNKVAPASVVHPCQQGFTNTEEPLKKAMTEIRRREMEAEKVRDQALLDQERQRFAAYHKSEVTRELAVQKAELKKFPENLLIFFDFNKTDLDLTAREMLGKVAKDIELFHPRKVILSGNADKVGSDAYNMKLATRRGIAVANYLIDHYGVEPDLLDIKAYGENNPRLPANMGKEARNRYVQIIFERDNRFYPKSEE